MIYHVLNFSLTFTNRKLKKRRKKKNKREKRKMKREKNKFANLKKGFYRKNISSNMLAKLKF